MIKFARRKLPNEEKMPRNQCKKNERLEKCSGNRTNRSENCCVFGIRRKMWNVLKARTTRVEWRGVGRLVFIYMWVCVCVLNSKKKTWENRIGKKACVKALASVCCVLDFSTLFLSFVFSGFVCFLCVYIRRVNPCITPNSGDIPLFHAIHSFVRWIATFGRRIY